MKRFPTATLLVFLAGCTHWKRDDSVLLQPLPERTKVEISANGTRLVAHGVRVDSQAVSYVKVFHSPSCDSCRAVIPRASIDSVRVSAISAPRTLILVATILAFIFFPDWGSLE